MILMYFLILKTIIISAHKGFVNKNDSTNSTESSGSLHLFYFTDTKLSLY